MSSPFLDFDNQKTIGMSITMPNTNSAIRFKNQNSRPVFYRNLPFNIITSSDSNFTVFVLHSLHRVTSSIAGYPVLVRQKKRGRDGLNFGQ